MALRFTLGSPGLSRLRRVRRCAQPPAYGEKTSSFCWPHAPVREAPAPLLQLQTTH